jgi:hypothetical protein
LVHSRLWFYIYLHYHLIPLYAMNLKEGHVLAIETLRQETAIAQEQQDLLQFQKGYRRFMEMSESQLLKLLVQTKKDLQAKRYAPILLVRFKVALEARLRFLRRKY